MRLTWSLYVFGVGTHTQYDEGQSRLQPSRLLLHCSPMWSGSHVLQPMEQSVGGRQGGGGAVKRSVSGLRT